MSRGLVLIESLQKNSSLFKIYVLCLDDFTVNFLKKNLEIYPQVIIIILSDIENNDVNLLSIKKDRSLIEYYFTLSPCLPLYLLKKYKLSHICSIDADLQFFSSPQILFDYLNIFSIIITPHKFSKGLQEFNIYGINNVSFQIFKNDIMPEKKIVSVKTYTVTFREAEDGTMDMHRVNDGFNTLELIGLIDFIGFEIREQSIGRLESNKIKRDVVVP